MINETVNTAVTEIMQQPAPLWIKALALLGGISLIQFTIHNSFNVVYFFAYVYGFIKWLLKRNDE